VRVRGREKIGINSSPNPNPLQTVVGGALTPPSALPGDPWAEEGLGRVLPEIEEEVDGRGPRGVRDGEEVQERVAGGGGGGRPRRGVVKRGVW